MKAKVAEIYKSFAGAEGKRWARPEEPILHTMVDEKEEPHVFFHNTNYRISRKYINAEKIKVNQGLSRLLFAIKHLSKRCCIHRF